MSATAEPDVGLSLPTNPMVLGHELLEVYRRFYRSAYAVANPGIADERSELLAAGAQLAAETLIEPIPSYRSSGLRVADAAQRLGLDEHRAADVTAFVDALMDGNELYEHQWQALQAAHAGTDVVVSGGTGSGKTEAFWLPVLTRLVIESAAWQPAGARPQRWWEAGSRLVAARDGETRPDARHASAGDVPDERARRRPDGPPAPHPR